MKKRKKQDVHYLAGVRVIKNKRNKKDVRYQSRPDVRAKRTPVAAK